MTRLRLFARVPAFGQSAWYGPNRHPESTEHFNSMDTLQHVARTLSLGSFDGALVDPPWRNDEPGATDPWVCAMALALAAPALRVGFRNAATRKAGTPKLAPVLGTQWLGEEPAIGPIVSVRVLVAANRWMAEDQLEYVLRHYPQSHPPVKPTGREASPPKPLRRSRIRPAENIPIVVGTPQEVADDLERLLASRASSAASPAVSRSALHNRTADGKTARSTPHHEALRTLELVPIHIPGSYEAFVRMVVPQLRHRGLIGEHPDSWRPTF